MGPCCVAQALADKKDVVMDGDCFMLARPAVHHLRMRHGAQEVVR